jgi:hypothetical protein
MKRLAFAAAPAVAFSLTSLTSAAVAQVIGRCNVEGQNPSGSTCAGTATIEKTGDTYRVVWSIDGTRFVGTGIGSDEGIAISYRSGSTTGIALPGKEPWGWSGLDRPWRLTWRLTWRPTWAPTWAPSAGRAGDVRPARAVFDLKAHSACGIGTG